MERKKLPPYVDRTFLGVPQKMAAMYRNDIASHLGPGDGGYNDEDLVGTDPVYQKLKKMELRGFDDESIKVHEVSWAYQYRMLARKMNERTYNHLRDCPIELLVCEFIIQWDINKRLREEYKENGEKFNTLCHMEEKRQCALKGEPYLEA